MSAQATGVRLRAPHDERLPLAAQIRELRAQVVELDHRDRDLHCGEDPSGRAAADALCAKSLLEKALRDYFDLTEQMEGRGGDSG